MKNSSPSYENIFYIDGTGISGIQDVNLDYSVSRAPINIIGIGHTQPVLNEALRGQLSFSREYIYNDPILSLTGDQEINGTLLYSSDFEESEGNVFGFTSGYLTRYSVSCEINSTPRVSCSFDIYGKIGSGQRNAELDYSGNAPINIIGFANQGSIILNLDQSQTNRITSFSQEINITRTPIYDLKQKTSENYYAPTQIITKTPIEISTSFEVEVDDYKTANLMDNILSGVYKNIGISIKDANKTLSTLKDHNDIDLLDHNDQVLYDGDIVTLYEFDLQSGNLLSESVKTNIDQSLSVSLSFKNYYK